MVLEKFRIKDEIENNYEVYIAQNHRTNPLIFCARPRLISILLRLYQKVTTLT
jgi:hypothetical protein